MCCGRVPQLLEVIAERVARADAEDENGGDERPEKTLFAVAEQVFLRSRTLVKTLAEQPKNLIRRIGRRVQRLGRHARRAL